MAPETRLLSAFSILSLTINLALAAPALQSLSTQLLRRRQHYQPLPQDDTDSEDAFSKNDLYKDEDGEATEESQRAFSNKWQKWGILILTILEVGAAIGLGVEGTIGQKRKTGEELWALWVVAGSAPCILIQAIALFIENWPTKAYSLGIRIPAGSAFLALWYSTSVYFSIFELESPPLDSDNVLLLLGLLLALSIGTIGILIPRRPQLFKDGVPVDNMRTGSAWARYTFGFASHIMERCYADGGVTLELVDIPILDSVRRASNLESQFRALKKHTQLYRQLISLHFWSFVTQVCLTTFSGALIYVPHYFMYQTIKALQCRAEGEDIGLKPYLWVVGMGVGRIVETFLQNYCYWICWMALYFPIRSQIAAAVFRKTLVKKDVKGPTNISFGDESKDTKKKGEEENGKKKDKKEEEEDELKNTKQGIVNLISIDAERVAEAAAFNHMWGESLVGLIIGFGFVLVILGWQSVLAGAAAILLLVPLNVYYSKRYVKGQAQLMTARDRKLAVLSEALQGIRQIKFAALESRWEDRINSLRAEELKVLKRVFIADTFLISCWIANPVLFSVAALSTHALVFGELTPANAFTALAVFSELEVYLSVFPEFVAHLLDAYVSAKRIEKYLNSEETKVQAEESESIAFEDADIAWPKDSEEKAIKKDILVDFEASEENTPAAVFQLKNVTLNFPRGELSLISGKTGSGKTLLLSALIGEADITRGRVLLPRAPPLNERFDSMATPANWILHDAVAYVAQIPWIENATLKENILFGLPYEKSRYKKTIQACALEKDLEMLSDGDETEIGANGINLSGGQKWRVAFARALYSRAGILVMDDVFSAVDAHVGKHLFDEALCGELARDRTRILVTHHLKLCERSAVYVVVLGEGRVLGAGGVEELRREGVLEQAGEEQIPEDVEEEGNRKPVNALDDSAANGLDKPVDPDSQKQKHLHKAKKPAEFTQEEKREEGVVKLSIYLEYIRAAGGVGAWSVIAACFFVNEGFILARSWIVKLWTASDRAAALTLVDRYVPESKSLVAYGVGQIRMGSELMMKVVKDSDGKDVWYWLSLYAGVSFVFMIFGTLKYWLVYLASLKASEKMFAKMLGTVLRAPSRWLDTVPRGRIINRFTKDFEKLDSMIGSDISFMCYNFMGVIGVFVAATAISPILLLAAFLMTLLCAYFTQYFLLSARAVKRLESISRSPIFEHFESTLTGVSTVRAFSKVPAYLSEMYSRIDTYAKAGFNMWLFNRWLGLRLQFAGSVFAMAVGAAVVWMSDISPSAAGFALSFSLTFSINLIWVVRRYSSMELDMNSTERIVEYASLPTEPTPLTPAPENWPSAGHLQVENLVVGYAPELEPVLKGISFEALPGERVAIVGRTGAGKSSFGLCLFRFIWEREGRILVDGVDLRDIRVEDIRRRFAVIPQDPVLFSGTIRSNLDPFNEYPDQLLYDALKRVHLIPPNAATTPTTTTPPSPTSPSTPISTITSSTNTSNPQLTLSTPISESGLNLSSGQRQLLCLARSLIHKPRLLLLDEATSSIDLKTEEAIRQSLNEEFKGTTTIIIAHRLAGVLDADRVVVMEGGKVVETGVPGKLLEQRGIFWGMVERMEGRGAGSGKGKGVE